MSSAAVVAVVADPVEVEGEAGVEVEDRNRAIAGLVNDLGWSSTKVARMFHLSERQTRRIAQMARGDDGAAGSEHCGQFLSSAEATAMLRDYRADPYTSVEERELATQWLLTHVSENKIQLFRPATRPTSGRRRALSRSG